MPQKPYKHIEFIEFKNVREIVDVRDNDGRELVHLLLVIAVIIQTSNKSRLHHKKLYSIIQISGVRAFHIRCNPFDQSESGFFNRKLDQIADQLEHKIWKRICFHTEVPGLRLPWDFWSVVHVIKQLRIWSINWLIKWNEQSKTSLRYQSELFASGGRGGFLDCNLRSDCSEMEWKI